MSGSALSSNWKQLQAKLKADQASSTPGSTPDSAAAPACAAAGKRKRDHNAAVEWGSRGGGRKEKWVKRDGAEIVHGKSARHTSQSNHNSKPGSRQKSKHVKMNGHATTPTATNGTTTTATSQPSKSDSLHTTKLNAGLTSSLPLGKYIALDCEMVGTSHPAHPSILARASLTTYTGAQLYDSYVLPRPTDAPITDYRTPISGITPACLRPGVARPFEEVLSTIKQILRGRVLVGHDLKHDLRVLDNLKHPKADTRDTALYRKFRDEVSGGGWPRLKDLAERYLGLGEGEFQAAIEAIVVWKMRGGRFGAGVSGTSSGGKMGKVAGNSNAFLDDRAEGEGVGRQGLDDEDDDEDEGDDHDEDEDQGQNGVDGHHTSSKPKKRKGKKKKKKRK
ncbi:RNA exonuclease 4 [Cyphellophora attinorum]|uniref:RNA exonuclease 4 n=1 Tax=Cyphellophora attinorum TaxID=1664694 RepID=A0A0N1HSK3_9EURO|nr:RNA exonuclease 4 [Phialophora attinorum]KPI39187.1 RNA exonuclease 4 [Phialophora attinorum]